jgi:hypothetical protein
MDPVATVRRGTAYRQRLKFDTEAGRLVLWSGGPRGWQVKRIDALTRCPHNGYLGRMATRRIELKTEWSTPKATAREFGLSAAELERITRAVKGFLVSYKGPLTVAPRRRPRRTMKRSRRRVAAR